MMYRKWIWRGIAVALPLALLPLALGEDAVPGSPVMATGQVFDAHTIPSEIRHPSFIEQGIIKEIFVKAGDRVTVGQELATEDADLEESELKSMQEEADSAVEQIKASELDEENKKNKYDKEMKLDPGSRSGEELEEKQLDWETAQAETSYAHSHHAKLVADVDKQKLKIQKMEMTSSIDGIVETVSIREGDFVDPSKPEGVMTIVKNDPLYADVGIPTKLATHLKVGDSLPITYRDIDPSKWLTATVKNIDPVASAGSDQETIRLQIPNTGGMRAGYWINVKLPDSEQAMK